MLRKSAPSDYEDLVRVIHERHDDMSKAYQRIAVYLTQNPNDVAVLSVNAIAERCEVHASNVVRFAQALGYDGFKTLQTLFQKRLTTAAPGFEARVRALQSELGARKDRSETGFLRDLVVRDGLAVETRVGRVLALRHRVHVGDQLAAGVVDRRPRRQAGRGDRHRGEVVGGVADQDPGRRHGGDRQRGHEDPGQPGQDDDAAD